MCLYKHFKLHWKDFAVLSLAEKLGVVWTCVFSFNFVVYCHLVCLECVALVTIGSYYLSNTCHDPEKIKPTMCRDCRGLPREWRYLRVIVKGIVIPI